MPEADGKKPSIQLQDRDLALLRGLFECRVMTIAHVGIIYFDGAIEYAKKRLQQLKAAGYIRERRRNVNEPSILSLDRDGLLLLQNRGMLTKYPRIGLSALLRRLNVSDRMIDHEITVMDVKASLHRALSDHSTLSILEFGTWPKLYEFTARHPRKGTIPVRPDGFLRLRETRAHGQVVEHRFFLEVDRSTESLETISSHLACYLDYYKTGAFARRFGASREDRHRYPFRVLVVCASEERMENIAHRLLQNFPPIRTQTLLATLAEVVGAPHDFIWRTPVNFHHRCRPIS